MSCHHIASKQGRPLDILTAHATVPGEVRGSHAPFEQAGWGTPSPHAVVGSMQSGGGEPGGVRTERVSEAAHDTEGSRKNICCPQWVAPVASGAVVSSTCANCIFLIIIELVNIFVSRGRKLSTPRELGPAAAQPPKP